MVLVVVLMEMKSKVECSQPRVICLFTCKMSIQDCRKQNNAKCQTHETCVKKCETRKNVEQWCKEKGERISHCVGVLKGIRANKMAAMKVNMKSLK